MVHRNPSTLLKNRGSPGADTGFPVGGGANSYGLPTYKLAGFSQKLHEIKKIFGLGGALAGGAPLDPPLQSDTFI